MNFLCLQIHQLTSSRGATVTRSQKPFGRCAICRLSLPFRPHDPKSYHRKPASQDRQEANTIRRLASSSVFAPLSSALATVACSLLHTAHSTRAFSHKFFCYGAAAAAAAATTEPNQGGEAAKPDRVR